MGLDMYLNKRIWLRPKFENVEVRGVDNGQNELIVTVQKLKYTVQEGMYWRKANAIHGWFVRNVQDCVDDCGVYEVTIEQLTELRDLCVQVLEAPDTAEEFLPPTQGFFFGGYDVDEDYFLDLRDTVSGISRLLNEVEAMDSNENLWDIDFTYQASW